MATGVLNPAEQAMKASMVSANLDGPAGDLHAAATPEEIAGRTDRNSAEMKLALAQTKDPQARAILLAELTNNAQDFSPSAAAGGTNPFDQFDGSAAAGGNPFDQFSPATAAPAKPKQSDKGLASDTGNLLGAGSVQLVRDANEIARKIPGVGDVLDNVLKSKAEQEVDKQGFVGSKPGTLDTYLKQYADQYSENLSPDMKTASSKNWIEEKDGSYHLGDAFTDWRSYYSGLVQSLPSNVMLIAPAMSLAKGVYASKLAALTAGGMEEVAAKTAAAKTAALTGALAGKVTEGLQQAGDSSISVRESILADKDKLKDSEAVQALMQQGMSLDDAVAKLADDASTKAMVLAGVATGVFSGAGDYVLAKAITGGIKGGVLRRIGLGALAEGPLEEFPQNYLSQVGENVAKADVNPNQSLTEGAMNQGVGGAVVGALQGGAMTGALGHSADQPKPAAEKPRTLDLGGGKVVTNEAELARALTPMAFNERIPALIAALERTHGTPLSDTEKAQLENELSAVVHDPVAIAKGFFPEPQEPAGATQNAAPTPSAPPAPVAAKALVRSAKQRLDALHKQMTEAQPQLAGLEGNQASFTPGTGQHLTPEQQSEYDFLSENHSNPEALAKQYNLTLAQESPSKQKLDKIEEGGAAVTDAVRAAKGQSKLGDTIERNQATAEKDVATARAAQKVVEPEAKVAKEATPVDTRPQPAAAIKSMEGDAAAMIGKRAPAATSKIAGTVAQASKVLEGEGQKTEAAKRAVEKSKAIEAQRSAKQSAEKKSEAVQPAAQPEKKSDTRSAEKPASEKPQAAPKKAKEAPVAPKKTKAVDESSTPKLGKKGEEAVAKSKAKEASKAAPSKVEKDLLNEVKSVLKKYPGTATPIALVRKELGLPHEVAKDLVERAQGKKKDVPIDLARKSAPQAKEHRVSIGLGAGPGSPMEKTLAGREIPRSFAHRIVDATAQRLGIRVMEKQDGQGAYLATPEGAIQVDASTTPDQIQQFISSLGFQLQQREVIAVRGNAQGESHAMDIYSPNFASDETAKNFWDHFLSMQGEEKRLVWGYSQARVDGKPAVRFLNFGARWSGADVQSILQLVDKAANETGVEIAADGVDHFFADLKSSLNEWGDASGDQGRAHLRNLLDAGGDREAEFLGRGASPQSAAKEVVNAHADLARKTEAATRVEPAVEGRDTAAADELASAVGKYFGGTAQAREVLDVVAPHTTEARLAEALAKRFGQQLHFFRNTRPDVFDFDGAAPDGSKRIFINTLNERPLMSVLGHELLHRMRQSDERAYQALVGSLSTYFSEKGKQEHADALRAALNGEHMSPTKMQEEFIADIVGEAFADPEFYNMLADREPGMFKRILDVVLRLFNTALDFTTDPSNSKYLTSVREARAVVAEAMARWASLQMSPNGVQGIRVFRGAASGLSKRSFGRERLGGSSGRAPSGLGVFFSTSKDYAAKYGHVENFMVNMKNPYEVKVDELPAFETVDDAYNFREGLREQGHDGVIIKADHLGGANTIVAFAPEVVARGDGTDLARKMEPVINELLSPEGKAVTNNPAAKQHLEITAANKVLDFLNRKIGDRMSPLGALPRMREYLTGRGVTQGAVAKSEVEAREFHGLFTKATPDQKARIKQYLTNRGAPKAMIGDAKLADAAERLKNRLIEIGAELVKYGVITQKDYEANKGMYLPRLYLRYLLDEAAFRGVGTGKKLSDLGYAKKRKDISEEYRRAVLGEIDDPAVLGAIAVGKPLRDIALLQFMHDISQNKEWVWAPSLIKFRGQDVSVAWVRNEIERVNEQRAFYSDPAQIAQADSYLKELEQTRDAAIKAQDGAKAPEDFKEIPDAPRYGYLRGLYVRSEIYDDMVGSAHTTPEDWASHLFGSGGTGTRLVQLWKASKVSLNPPAQIRNLISNFMLLHLSGVAMHRLPGRLAQAVNSMIKQDKYYDIALKYGVTANTFAAQELYKIRDEFLKDEGAGGPLAFFRYGKIIASHFGDAYQAMETLGKLAKIIDEMETYNATEADAAIEANKWLFDYSLVPQAVRALRNLPLGMPFVTFYYKLAPRMLEVALKAPWRLAPYIGAMWLIPQMFASMFGGLSPDDQDKIKKTLVQRLREKGNVYVLPKPDEHGNWTAADLSYFVPFQMFIDAAKDLAQGNISDLVKTVGLFSGPFVDLPAAILTGKDPFTGRDIVQAGDPPSLQVGSWLTYLYNMAMPPIITNQNLIGPDLGNPNHVLSGRLPSALYGATNKYGDQRNTLSQALLGAAGVSIYPFNPEHGRITEIKKMQFDMEQATRRLHQQLADRGLTDEERQKVIATYQEEAMRRGKKLQEYAAETADLPIAQ